MTHSTIRAAAQPGTSKAMLALFIALVFAVCSLWSMGAMAQDATERSQAQVHADALIWESDGRPRN